MKPRDIALSCFLMPIAFVLIGISQTRAHAQLRHPGSPLLHRQSASEPMVPPGIAQGRDCALSLDQAGRVNLGRVAAAAVAPAAGRPGFGVMSRRTLVLTGSCSNPRTFALRFTLPPADDSSFRFGDRGVLKISLADAYIDGRAASLVHGVTQSGGTGRSSTVQTALALRPGQDVLILAADPASEGRSFSVRINFEGQVPVSGISGELNLSANARIDLL